MTKRKKIRATVTEALIFSKYVEILIDEDADIDEIHQALRDKAFEQGLTDGINGWYMDGSKHIEVKIEQ